MKITATDERLPGVQILDYEIFSDDRGFFYESYSQRKFAEIGIDLVFVQDNHSRSRAGVVRGLHYQAAGAEQWRLVRCTVGEIYDVIVDIDAGSPTYGEWIGVHLSAENRRQLLIPPAYAHGFTVLSEIAEVQYKCTGLHNPPFERAMAYNDPDLAIEWPITGEPVISAKDAAAPSFASYRDTPDFPAGWDRKGTHA